jgi:hypothetical protein
MSRLRGDHTSLIPLAEEILYMLKKGHRGFTYSPGVIIRKNIKVKEVTIKIVEDTGSLLVTFLMKSSKQLVRVYSMQRAEFVSGITKYCNERQILIK